jgi:hypothetical protein
MKPAGVIPLNRLTLTPTFLVFKYSMTTPPLLSLSVFFFMDLYKSLWNLLFAVRLMAGKFVGGSFKEFACSPAAS